MRKVLIRMFVGLTITLLLILTIGWIGTRFSIQAFELPDRQSQDLGTIDPPADLPAPVARFVEVAFGDQIPIVESAILVGTADLRVNGITLPVREKMYYDAGHAYYHYFQIGWFGQPIYTAHERFVNGKSTLRLPGIYTNDDPQINAAANQGLWAEAVWLPSVYFTDDRLEWQAVDDDTARLVLPNAAEEEAFTIRFDPDTGLISTIETMRFQNVGDTQRLHWKNTIKRWERINGVMIPVEAETQWDDNDPWAVWHIDDILYNVDVSARLAEFGGDIE